MPFSRIPGVTGLVWVPEASRDKKHPCPGCFHCQHCSHDRCEACLKACGVVEPKGRGKEKESSPKSGNAGSKGEDSGTS